MSYVFALVLSFMWGVLCSAIWGSPASLVASGIGGVVIGVLYVVFFQERKR